MRQKIVIIGFAFLFFMSPLCTVLFAQTNTPSPEPSTSSSNNDGKEELERKKREYEAKLNQLQKQSNTLSSQIEYMDTQVYLTELRAQETEQKIETTEKEIDTLGNRIEGLDSSLDSLSRALIDRVVDGYKQRQVSVFELLLDSQNANDLIGRVKYVKTAQENNQKLLIQVQQTKSNFQEQKKLREKKQDELASLKDILSNQREELIAQQEQKRQLLSVTQSDEATYKRLIDEANRQIASYKSFVASTGVNVVPAGSLGTGEGGWYLSQRDSRWASNRMGDSSESILDVGCFITSISMVFRFYGYDMTPVTLASDPKYFLPRSAYMYIPSNFGWPGGKTYRNVSYSDLKTYLNNGTPVIAGVRGSSHYIVLKKVDGDDFIMNDPIYGPDLKVSDHYSLSGPYGVFQ